MLLNSLQLETPATRQGRDKDELYPIDLQHLRRYTMGDPKLEKEVLELFIAQLPLTIRALSEAGSDRDWQMAAHTLKGSGRAVGAWRVARLAEHAERPDTIKSAAMRSHAVAGLEVAAEEARTFISLAYSNEP
jgi:HPt (histidine-containing phosphotransfer) domain-containing protein